MIVVEVKGRKALDRIKNIVYKLPKSMEAAGKEFGESLALRVKRNITAKRLLATRRMWESVNWSQTGLNGSLKIVDYAVELQEARPAMEVVQPNTRLWNWAFLRRNFVQHHGTSARFPRLEAKIRRKEPIILRRYDVWEGPLVRTLNDLDSIYQRHLTRLVESRGAVV